MDLEEIIIEKIKAEGPLSFADYMGMCLYYPELGFYTAPRSSIGQDGAFYTSAYLTPVFGAMVGRQLVEMWQAMGYNEFTVIEYGAGTGILSHDILSYLQTCYPAMYEMLTYGIIEKSPVMREIEQRHLQEKVTWYDAIAEVPDVKGCVFSNELVDNFPVRRIVMSDELMEVHVTYDKGFREILQPACPEIKQYMQELGINLPEGFQTEINLEATHWVEEVARNIKQGYLMTVDYGYSSEELYKPSRSAGTLLCYFEHTINDAYYRNIGKQDITAHVNFSALSHWGAKNGLREKWFTEQCHFLLKMGFTDFLNETLSTDKDIVRAAKKAAMIRHTLLFDMGSKFKVLIQEKI